MTIFQFNDYRLYLKHFLKNLPRHGRGELTKIARHLHMNTTLLSQIMSGGRDFSLEQSHELSLFIGHTEIELEYFSLLVQKERAGSRNLKNHIQKKIDLILNESKKLSQRLTHERDLSENERSIFYSSWVYSAIHLFTSVEADGVSLEQICNRLKVKKQKASEVIHFLLSSGLCIEENGKYKMGAKSTFVGQGSPHLLKHHSNWRLKAIEKSELITEEELMYTGQSSLSKKDFAFIRESIAELIKKTTQTVKDSPAEDIAALNIDWFWIDK